VKATHPEHGTFLQVAPVLAGSDRSEGSYRVRDVGQTDTDELLAGVGMSPDDRARLREAGVVA
jgi:crotonobetainyl-CoA:carnitine CoA-transferase CaiB-like acyl-CoA transferase